jgi:hypothetical protein
MAPDAQHFDTGQQRAATDAGLTGDKIKVCDPAAAPVETDAEAAGSATPWAVFDPVRNLMAEMLKADPVAKFGAYRQPHEQHASLPVLLSLIGALAVLGVVLGIVGLG